MKDGVELNGHPDASIDDHLDPPASVKQVAATYEEVASSPREVVTRSGTKKKTLEALCSIRCHYNSMAHLKSVEEFYSPRKTEASDTADKILQITFSACTPRLLVRPSQPPQVLSPDSGEGCGDKDITSSDNGSGVADTSMESSSETGWSVRDNPMASNLSSKPDVDSDDEDLDRNVCSKLITDMNHDSKSATPSVEHVLNLASGEELQSQEVEPKKGRELTLEAQLTSASSSKVLYLGEERVIKPYVSEDAESTKRTRKAISRSSSYNPPQEALRSLIVEDNCSCSGMKHEVKLSSDVGEYICKGGPGQELVVMTPPPYLLSVQVSGKIVDVARKSWKSVLSYSDLVLGGSLLIALALPFAVMISKLLVCCPEDQFRFVPT